MGVGVNRHHDPGIKALKLTEADATELYAWYGDEQNSRVVRRGSWCDRDPVSLLSSYRKYSASGYPCIGRGFRVVLAGGSAR